MASNLTAANCFDWLDLAEKYTLEGVINAADHYILSNFLTLVRHQNFLLISKDALSKWVTLFSIHLICQKAEELDIFTELHIRPHYDAQIFYS